MSISTEPIALTIDQFAARYSLNPNTVRTNVTRNPNSLPPVLKIGRTVRFLLEDVEAWQQKKIQSTNAN